MIKALIVDDSAFMRNAISSMLSSDPEIQVVGLAKDGLEAIAKVKTLRPDIVTLDVEMPRMNGIEALKHIMASTPVPVIMVSSMTTEEAQITLESLELGALDYIPKNLYDLSVNILKIKEDLIAKIKHLAKKKVLRRATLPTEPVIVESMPKRTGELHMHVLAFGTSTGGPKALHEIIPKLPKDFPLPIVIAQHMPKAFTGPFAERLDQLSQIEVREAKQGDVLESGKAFVAPGGSHMRVKRTTIHKVNVDISSGNGEYAYRPSVDVLVSSVAEAYPGRALGVILTGMGSDGVRGIEKLKESGGKVYVQNEETCVVFGMPKAVVEAHLADKVLPIEEIAGEIVNAV
jgi:two-component system chemotaxis response regulator CheB